jgi:peptidoglycan/xylan/chitin deacetylase (PgdA/CDA1 family)
MKNWLKKATGHLARITGIPQRRQGQDALILMLHRVLPQPAFDQLQFQKMLAVSESGLRNLIRYMQAHFTLIQIDDYLSLNPLEHRSERFACLTFDDGWQDNYWFALPIIEDCKAPVSIYLSTGFLETGKHFWWQTIGDTLARAHPNPVLKSAITKILRQYHLGIDSPLTTDHLINQIKQLPPHERNSLIAAFELLQDEQSAHGLTWQQIQQMADTGLIRFGTHTVNHVLLTQLNQQDAEYEIRQCKRDLLHKQPLHFNGVFCYPNGDVNPTVAGQVAAAGYRAALTTQSGYASRAAAERFMLARINVTEATAQTPALLNYRLLKIKRRQEAVRT